MTGGWEGQGLDGTKGRGDGKDKALTVIRGWGTGGCEGQGLDGKEGVGDGGWEGQGLEGTEVDDHIYLTIHHFSVPSV